MNATLKSTPSLLEVHCIYCQFFKNPSILHARTVIHSLLNKAKNCLTIKTEMRKKDNCFLM